MTEITVRSMKEKDIKQAADIHRRVLREGLGQSTKYEIETLFKTFIKKSPKTCIVAEKDGIVVGFIIGFIKEWGFGVERSGWIEMIEVDPKIMGEGIGKMLGEALIQQFKHENQKKFSSDYTANAGDPVFSIIPTLSPGRDHLHNPITN